MNNDVSPASVRVGVVGAGWWASVAHIPGVLSHPHAELVGIADPDAERLAKVADHLGVEGRFPDQRALIDAGVDALVIAVPHTLHYPLACEALDAGKHVLMEKPLVLTAAHAHDLAARAQAQSLHLLTGYTYQFADSAKRVRELLAGGELGEPLVLSALFNSAIGDFYLGRSGLGEQQLLGGPARATYMDPRLSGGGQGQAQVPHAVAMLLWATGLRARRVSAFMKDRDATVDLVDAIACELDGGVLTTIASAGVLGEGQTEHQVLTYTYTRGTVVQDLISGEVVVHPAGGDPYPLPAPADSYPVEGPVHALIDLIRGEGEDVTPIAASVATVELVEAAYRSAAAGGAPVDVADLD